jgi:hypothetical protein
VDKEPASVHDQSRKGERCTRPSSVHLRCGVAASKTHRSLADLATVSLGHAMQARSNRLPIEAGRPRPCAATLFVAMATIFIFQNAKGKRGRVILGLLARPGYLNPRAAGGAFGERGVEASPTPPDNAACNAAPGPCRQPSPNKALTYNTPHFGSNYF